MELSINKKGWLEGVNILPSPNFSARPENIDIDLLVIHNISLPPNQYGSKQVQEFFQNKLDFNADPYFKTIQDLKVSSHLFIERSGEITQFVSFLDKAWHAGVSSFEGQEQCNEFSIGIELEGSDFELFEPAQYEQLVLVTKLICRKFPGITPDRITGHSDIAPGRKTDPGPFFDWMHYFALLNE